MQFIDMTDSVKTESAAIVVVDKFQAKLLYDALNLLAMDDFGDLLPSEKIAISPMAESLKKVFL